MVASKPSSCSPTELQRYLDLDSGVSLVSPSRPRILVPATPSPSLSSPAATPTRVHSTQCGINEVSRSTPSSTKVHHPLASYMDRLRETARSVVASQAPGTPPQDQGQTSMNPVANHGSHLSLISVDPLRLLHAATAPPPSMPTVTYLAEKPSSQSACSAPSYCSDEVDVDELLSSPFRRHL